jgi:hypothetical protein
LALHEISGGLHGRRMVMKRLMAVRNGGTNLMARLEPEMTYLHNEGSRADPATHSPEFSRIHFFGFSQV